MLYETIFYAAASFDKEEKNEQMRHCAEILLNEGRKPICVGAYLMMCLDIGDFDELSVKINKDSFIDLEKMMIFSVAIKKAAKNSAAQLHQIEI